MQTVPTHIDVANIKKKILEMVNFMPYYCIAYMCLNNRDVEFW